MNRKQLDAYYRYRLRVSLKVLAVLVVIAAASSNPHVRTKVCEWQNGHYVWFICDKDGNFPTKEESCNK